MALQDVNLGPFFLKSAAYLPIRNLPLKTFRNPPRKEHLVGRRQQGRYWAGASHPGLAPRDPGDLRGMNRGTQRRGPDKNSFPSPFGLRTQGPESGDQSPLSVSNTQDTTGQKKQEQDTLANSVSWETGAPQKTLYPSQRSSQPLPGKNPLCYQKIPP